MKPAEYLWGPLSKFGLAAALVTAALDQALKVWLLFVFDLQNAPGPVDINGLPRSGTTALP